MRPFLVVVLLLVTACGRNDPPAIPPPTSTPSAVAAKTPTPAPIPTATRVAPTATAAPTPRPEPTATAVPSPEILLAIIQHGRGIQPSDPRVPPFAQLLDKLEAKCTEDRVKLADLTAGANKVMGDRGAKEPILDTLKGVAVASDGVTPESRCEDLFTAYALLRTQGVRR